MGGDAGVPYVAQLTPIFVRSVTDADDELRNNAVFALGVLVTTSAGGLAQYPLLTRLLAAAGHTGRWL